MQAKARFALLKNMKLRQIGSFASCFVHGCMSRQDIAVSIPNGLCRRADNRCIPQSGRLAARVLPLPGKQFNFLADGLCAFFEKPGDGVKAAAKIKIQTEAISGRIT
jgi:hypothetical protein